MQSTQERSVRLEQVKEKKRWGYIDGGTQTMQSHVLVNKEFVFYLKKKKKESHLEIDWET